MTTIRTLGIRSELFTHRRTNTDLLAIDAALEQYWVSENTPAFAEDGVAAQLTRLRIQALNLLNIVKACHKWIENKAARDELDSSTRATAIRRLAASATDEVEKLSKTRVADHAHMRGKKIVGSLQDLELPDIGHRGGIDRLRPEQRLAARTRFAMIRTAMAGQGGGKGLDRDVLLESNPGGVNPRNYNGARLEEAFRGQFEEEYFDDDINAFNVRETADFSSQQKFIFDYARQTRETFTRVAYLTDDERWQQKIVIHEKKFYLLENKYGDRKDNHIGKLRPLFVISKNNDMYIEVESIKEQIKTRIGHDDRRATNRSGVEVGNSRGFTFQHSSIMAGKAVLFAGDIETNDAGCIVTIGNSSGHYKPNLLALVKALRVLRVNGADLASVTAELTLFRLGQIPKENAGAINRARIGTLSQTEQRMFMKQELLKWPANFLVDRDDSFISGMQNLINHSAHHYVENLDLLLHAKITGFGAQIVEHFARRAAAAR